MSLRQFVRTHGTAPVAGIGRCRDEQIRHALPTRIWSQPAGGQHCFDHQYSINGTQLLGTGQFATLLESVLITTSISLFSLMILAFVQLASV
ncbi:MAG TPA: hypothetical protein VKB53_04830, partial [Gammaproteobacteria bacterium]|nr:hypothetical protein [Gammaproteobacteria bacterium]